MMRLSPGQVGSVCALVAVMFFATNDTMIKFLSGDYALHQVVLIRSALGLMLTLCFIAPFNGGFAIFKTKRMSQHFVRGGFTVMANMTFFLGLSVMPLADATAIFFISPILITLFSIVFLGEKVGPWRWTAILVGFLGVVIMIRPGTESFQLAALYPLVAAFCYATLNTMTRRMGSTESAATLSVYIQLTFIVVTVLIGLALGDGRFGDQSDPALKFLLRAWSWPPVSDFGYFLIIGIGIAGGGFLISQAYRVAEAAFVAPFEYAAMPLAVFYGIVIFDEWPDAVAYVGMTFIVAAGIITIWRETVNRKAAQRPRMRR
jgi:drug/metabolite transporter (DMT)-like permease